MISMFCRGGKRKNVCIKFRKEKKTKKKEKDKKKKEENRRKKTLRKLC